MRIRISPLLLLVIALVLIIHASTAAALHAIGGGGETCVTVGSFHHCGTSFELAYDQNGQPVILHPGDPGYYKP